MIHGRKQKNKHDCHSAQCHNLYTSMKAATSRFVTILVCSLVAILVEAQHYPMPKPPGHGWCWPFCPSSMRYDRVYQGPPPFYNPPPPIRGNPPPFYNSGQNPLGSMWRQGSVTTNRQRQRGRGRPRCSQSQPYCTIVPAPPRYNTRRPVACNKNHPTSCKIYPVG